MIYNRLHTIDNLVMNWFLALNLAQIMMLAQREQRGPEILEQLQRLGVQPQVNLQGFQKGRCEEIKPVPWSV